MKYKLVAAAILAAGMSNVANAAIVQTSTDVNNTGGSELVLNLWDGTHTYSLDLGVQMGSPLTTGALANIASDANASLFFTGGVLNSNVQWGIMAADNVVTGTTATTAGDRMLTTSTTASWTYTNAQVLASATGLNSFINNLNLTGSHPTVTNGSDVSTSVADGNSWQGGGMLGSWTQNNAFTAMGQGAGSMLLVQVSQLSTTNSRGSILQTPSDLATYNTLGQFTLAANGALSFAPVPVPAAVWLFGSALMGMVGVARRRQQAV